MLNSLYRSLIAIAVAVSGVMAAHALPADYYATESKLASGHWVKVKVTETGMQQLTFDQLRAMGFSDPGKVAVYGYPGMQLRDFAFSSSMPDDLPAVASAIYGDKLVFFGVGRGMVTLTKYGASGTNHIDLLRNVYGLASYYYLTDSQPAERVALSQGEFAGTTPVTSAYGYAVHDFTEHYPGIGALLFSESFHQSPLEVEFRLPGLTDARANIMTSLAVAGQMPYANRATVDINGSSNEFQITGFGGDTSYWHFRYSSIRNPSFDNIGKTDDDLYKLTLSVPSPSDDMTGAMCDYVGVRYLRSTTVGNEPQQHMVLSQTTPGMGVALTEAGDNIKVWSVSPDAAPVEYEVAPLGDTGMKGVVTTSTLNWDSQVPGLDLLVFDPSAELYTPAIEGDVKPSNLHADTTPDMIIVTNDRTYDEGCRMADAHREHNPLVNDVKVVRFSDLMDEFASGQYHPMALRRYIKMLYDRDPSKLKGVFILSSAEMDNTGVSVNGGLEALVKGFVPMLECEDVKYYNFGREPDTYGTDAIYGMLSDKFYYNKGSWDNSKGVEQFLRSLLYINVGRVPAADAVQASQYIDKAIRHLTSPSSKPMWNRCLLLAGAGDSNDFFTQGIAVNSMINGSSTAAAKAPSVVVSDLYMSLYPANSASTLRISQNRIQQQLTRGSGMFVYFGHSLQHNIIGDGNTWSSNLDQSLKIDDTPFTIFATCETMVFDKATSSLQSDMLLNPTGGMLAGVGPTRPVYANHNKYMAYAVVYNYYNRQAGAAQGDVFRMARNHLCTSPVDFGTSTTATGPYVNHLSYNFGGDPMLPLYSPDGTVTIDNINGAAPGSDVSLSPLTEYTIEGSVRNPAGDVDTDFNGTVTVAFYDGRYERSSDPSRVDTSNPSLTVTLEDMLLQEALFEVRDGRFTGNVTLGAPSYTGLGNRVTLFAINDDNSRRAVGNLPGVNISNVIPDDVADISAPRIMEMYADDPSFVNGDQLPASFTLYAKIDGGTAGLPGNSDRLGGTVSVSLDDTRKLPGADGAVQMHPDGTASMALNVSGLADGPHHLKLTVKSITGQSDEREIHFSVMNVAEAYLLCDEPHLRDKAVFSIKTDLAEDAHGRLIIATPDGRVVYTDPDASLTSPYTWNLDDTEGNPVADGVYNAIFYFNSGRHYGATPPLRIFVGR